jgi:hypothetical protein
MRTLLLAIALLFSAQTAQSQTGVVSGQILNAGGQPAIAVRVAVMPVPREGETHVPTLVALTSTDTNGRYTLENIEPGQYYITAGKVDQPVYFPGVLSQSEARVVAVTARSVTSGIDFKVFELPTFTISGRVVLQPGQQMPSNITMTGPTYQYVALKADGTFEFARLRPNAYTLLHSAPFSAPVEVVVKDADVKGLEIPLPLVVTVAATIVMENGGTPPNVSLSFLDTSKNEVIEATSRQSFAIAVPEAEYRVSINRLPNGYAIKTLMAGATNLLTSPLKLSRTNTPPAITVTLAAIPTVAFAGRAVSLRGVLQEMRKITLESGEGTDPVAGTVLPDGSFSFDRITPGAYMAVLWVAGSEELKIRVTVPPAGNRQAEILIPELRNLSLRMTVEEKLVSILSSVTVRFTEAGGAVISNTVDSSVRDMPFEFSLREGQYRVSVTIRHRTAGTDRPVVKTLTAGTVDLLKDPLSVGAQNLPEIRITLGR